MGVEQGHRQRRQQHGAARTRPGLGGLVENARLHRPAQRLHAVPEQEGHPAPAGEAQQQRVLRQQGGQAEDPGADQQRVAQHAERGHRQVVFAAQALGEDEGVLRADGDDQAGGHQQSVQVALPHGVHSDWALAARARRVDRARSASLLATNRWSWK
ncbi:hypothetical protein D9M68_656160 [compost metagenome]